MNYKPPQRVLEIAQMWANESSEDLRSFAQASGAGEVLPPSGEATLNYKREVAKRDALRLERLRSELGSLIGNDQNTGNV